MIFSMISVLFLRLSRVYGRSLYDCLKDVQASGLIAIRNVPQGNFFGRRPLEGRVAHSTDFGLLLESLDQCGCGCDGDGASSGIELMGSSDFTPHGPQSSRGCFSNDEGTVFWPGRG